MTNLRSHAMRAASTATDFACGAVGRRNVVRAARFVVRRACLDIPNDLASNGEAVLQRWIIGLVARDREIHVIDAGANIGRWSLSMLAAAADAGRLEALRLHAFEPSSYTFEILSEALRGRSVILRRAALCERSGSAALHILAPGAGTNSLHSPAFSDSDGPTEEVAIMTLDSYAEQAGLDHIALVKIDTEGHDSAVLRGASNLFMDHRISLVQFEYNHRWIYARAYLRDAFDLLAPMGYRLGKLTPRGVEFYPGWDIELETFVEGNYVAAVPRIADQLPSVRWWKKPEPEGESR